MNIYCTSFVSLAFILYVYLCIAIQQNFIFESSFNGSCTIHKYAHLLEIFVVKLSTYLTLLIS